MNSLVSDMISSIARWFLCARYSVQLALLNSIKYYLEEIWMMQGLCYKVPPTTPHSYQFSAIRLPGFLFSESAPSPQVSTFQIMFEREQSEMLNLLLLHLPILLLPYCSVAPLFYCSCSAFGGEHCCFVLLCLRMYVVSIPTPVRPTYGSMYCV